MSRLIKFRAWHKFAHKMASIDMLDFMLDAYRARSGKSSGSGHLTDIELMQFTSLLDRNGNEVYEGDIVTGRIHHLFDKVEETKVVSYDALRAVFVPFGCVVNYDGQTWIESVQDFDGFSVIGNVYEHPELLEQIKESK